MAVKVKTRFDSLEEIKDLNNSADLKEEVGSAVVEEIKDFVSKGISPVKGVGRFAEYKDPESYPGDKKQKRPVNLTLSGEMLEALEYWLTRTSLLIGYKKRNVKAEAHNFGTKDVPKRPFIPVEVGSEFNHTIMKKIRDIYINKINSIIKKSSR